MTRARRIPMKKRIISKSITNKVEYRWAVLGANTFFDIDITDPTRRQPYVVARRMLWAYLRENTACTIKGMAKLFGMDHSSAIHQLHHHDDYVRLSHITMYKSYCIRYEKFCEHMDSYAPVLNVDNIATATFTKEKMSNAVGLWPAEAI